MMGPKQEAQAALFYEFSLQDYVPQDHLLRSIDRFVDLASIRAHLTDFYSHTGRPSLDQELLIRMLLVGYCFGVRSERRLCEEVHLNLAYRWFCRLDLNDRVPDHSTFSKNRHGRFWESELLRHLFETTAARCIEEGLVSGQRMAIDASLIEADANNRTQHRGTSGMRQVSIRPMRHAPSASTSTRWMRPRSEQRARFSPSSRPIPIRRANGRRHAKGPHSLASPTTT
jgi:transposase